MKFVQVLMLKASHTQSIKTNGWSPVKYSWMAGTGSCFLSEISKPFDFEMDG